MATGRNIQHQDSIISDGTTIAYSYCHSRRRTLGIIIRPDKSIAVRVPLRTSVREIRDFVSRRAAWIAKIWDRLDACPAEPQQDYRDGALVLLQGTTYRLEIRTGCGEERLELQGERLLLCTATHPTADTIRNLIDRWYRKLAVAIVQQRAIQCHQRMLPEGIPLPPITIRSMKSRWGSYSYRTGRVTLNLNLLKAPQACLDYVIIHELCHIRLRHHGPDFWALVGRYLPEYRQIQTELKRYISL